MASEKLYPHLKGSDRVREICGRCGGSGVIPQFGHVLNGVCFDCNGAGGFPVLVSSVRAREGARRRAEAKRQAKMEKDRAERAAFEAEHADLLAEMKASGNQWLIGATETFQIPTEGQIEAYRAELAKIAAEAARKAAAEPVPVTTERIKITGVILGFKEVDDNYSYNGRTITKALVRDDRGFTVYGTCARDFPDKGDRLEFMAAVERSPDDELFGFYKRPTKVKVLDTAE